MHVTSAGQDYSLPILTCTQLLQNLIQSSVKTFFTVSSFAEATAGAAEQGRMLSFLGAGNNRLGQQQEELTNFTLQFKTFFTNWYKTEKFNI